MFFDKLINAIDGASSCHGKQPYSQQSAEKAAIQMAIKKKEPFEAYKCRHCENWHVGHPRFWKWSADQKKQIGL